MLNSKVMLSLLGGVAAGIAIGVLFAPDKGSKMRKNLSNTAKDFADKILSDKSQAKFYHLQQLQVSMENH